jgi:hypothetical protein
VTNAKGIDVSSYQAETPPLAGLSFLIARASIGTGKDSRYAHHIANAKAAGLVTGAYHFGYNGVSQDTQADIFVEAAGNVDLLFLDVEGPSAPSQNQTRAFIDRVHRHGRACGLYHSLSGYFTVNQDYDWVAKWSTTAPNIPWDFWQYRGSPLDLDQFHGTDAALRKFVGIPPAPPSDVETGMIIPQVLGHCVAVVDARIYPAPDTSAVPIASKLPKGSVVRKFGGIQGWRFCEVNLGGHPMYAWLRADETDDSPPVLTITDGPAAADTKHAISLLVDNHAVYTGDV